MNRITIALILSLLFPSVASAQDDRGLSLMERGAELFFRGLKDEMEPALEGLLDLAEDLQPAMRSFAREMGPAFAEILKEIKDFSRYHPPEILPNGDIIIRRRQDTPPDAAPPKPPSADAPGKQIDL